MIVEFESSVYEVDEDAGVVSLTLVKRTPTTQSVTVLFSTKNGSAVGVVVVLTIIALSPGFPLSMLLSQVVTFSSCFLIAICMSCNGAYMLHAISSLGLFVHS